MSCCYGGSSCFSLLRFYHVSDAEQPSHSCVCMPAAVVLFVPALAVVSTSGSGWSQVSARVFQASNRLHCSSVSSDALPPCTYSLRLSHQNPDHQATTGMTHAVCIICSHQYNDACLIARSTWRGAACWWPRLLRSHGRTAWDDGHKDYSDLPQEVRCHAQQQLLHDAQLACRPLNHSLTKLLANI